MSNRSFDVLQRYLRRIGTDPATPDDSLLLSRFVATQDREAFEQLMVRHGPMVLGTARRLVDNQHDAEDVFQAVFLSLARLAKSIRNGCTLPAWLHMATCRVAAKARRKRLSSGDTCTKEPSQTNDPVASLAWQEVRQALDDELQQLPARLRSPLLLCYLSGLTRDEAARQLGCSLATLKRRLEAGRKLLRVRLEKRGIAAVGLALTVLTPESLQAVVSRSLQDACLSTIFLSGVVTPARIAVLVLGSTTPLRGLIVNTILGMLAVAAIGVGIYGATAQSESNPQSGRQEASVRSIAEENLAPNDDPLPAGAIRRFGTSKYRFGINVHDLAVSPDGKLAIVANDNDTPRVFDLTTGRVVYGLNWGSIDNVAFSPDGRTIVMQQDYDLVVFDAATGSMIRSIKGPRTDRWHAQFQFSPDGKAVGVLSVENNPPRAVRLHLIDFASGKLIRDFDGDLQSIVAFAFSPDGKLLASGGYENERDNYFIRIWDATTGKELRRCWLGKAGYGVGSLAFSPDGKTLATVGTQAEVFLRLFDVETAKEQRAFPRVHDLRTRRDCVAFSPDGMTVAVALDSIRLYDPMTGMERLHIDQKGASNLHFMDGGETLTAAVSGTIYRWDAVSGKVLTPTGANSEILRVLVTPDGGRVITCGLQNESIIWDGLSGKQLRNIDADKLALSPDGRYLAWLEPDNQVRFTIPQLPKSIPHRSCIRLFDIAADKLVGRIFSFKRDVQSFAFDPTGKKLVTVEGQGTVILRIQNVDSGEIESSIALTPHAPKKPLHANSVSISPDGGTVIVDYVPDEDKTPRWGLRGPPHEIRLWSVATGEELPQLGTARPIDNAFSPDGKLVVTRGENAVYELTTGKRVASLPDDPMMYIRAAAFSRDGKLLALAVPDGVIQIWDTATWSKRKEFRGYEDRTITLTFGPDGKLYTGNRDSTVLVFDVPAMLISQ
jgi:RNA polymerase sigma factor (sigma-70 family)